MLLSRQSIQEGMHPPCISSDLHLPRTIASFSPRIHLQKERNRKTPRFAAVLSKLQRGGQLFKPTCSEAVNDADGYNSPCSAPILRKGRKKKKKKDALVPSRGCLSKTSPTITILIKFFLLLVVRHLLLVANIVTTSKALVTTCYY